VFSVIGAHRWRKFDLDGQYFVIGTLDDDVHLVLTALGAQMWPGILVELTP